MHHPKWIGSQVDKARPSSSLWGSKECKFNEVPEVKLHSTSFAHFCQWWRFLQRRWWWRVSNFVENCKCTVKWKIAFSNFASDASGAHADVRDSTRSITPPSPANYRELAVSAADEHSDNNTVLLGSVSDSPPGTDRHTRVSPPWDSCSPLRVSMQRTESSSAHTSKRTQSDADTPAHRTHLFPACRSTSTWQL